MGFFRRHKRLSVLMLIATIMLVAFGIRQFVSKSSIPAVVSRETTYLTEPLRADGFPDYVAALNERAGRGVTAENNASVLLWQALGPGRIKTEARGKFFEMLGVPQPPEKGTYFVELRDFPAWKEKQKAKSAEKKSKKDAGAKDELSVALERPWSKQEFPVIAAWLEANEKPLGLVVQASKRSRRYDPLLSDQDGTISDPAWDRGSVNWSISLALAARAMLRAHDGKIGDAWQDLLACHRLARLAAQFASVMKQTMTATNTDRLAADGDIALLQRANLTAAQIAAMRNDLDLLPPMPQSVDAIDFGERCRQLAGILWVARQLAEELERPASQQGMAKLSSMKGVDWSTVLRLVNCWFDRSAAVMRESSFAERAKARERLKSDLREEVEASKGWRAVLPALASPRETRSRVVGVLFVGLCLPSVNPDMEGRAEMRLKLARVAFALTAYHADHGSYPARLADLSPKYIKEVPKDVFGGGAELHYTRSGAGYLLYSVGVNGRDDGGKGVKDRSRKDEDWDDLAVRMPGEKQ